MPIYYFKSINPTSKFYKTPLEVVTSTISEYERIKHIGEIKDEFGDTMKPIPTKGILNLKGNGWTKRGIQ